jgi:hypothetical protein
MSHTLYFVADEQTARITPDALRVRLEQSGFPILSQRGEGNEVELLTDGVVLWLLVEAGFVVEIHCEVTFVNDRKSNRVLELIESMGWVAAE